MIKKRENKTRKRLRITQCVLYLLEIILCTFPYISIPGSNSEDEILYRTIFDIIGYIGGNFPEAAQTQAFSSVLPLFLVFPIIPIIGFFFCALDKERNLKNIVSIICSVLGVLFILTMVSLNLLTYFSVFALLIYILIDFITSMAMVARLQND